MTRPDRGPTPTFVLISRVWAVAGALALVVALVTRSLVVAVFGGLALLAAAVVFGLQAAQDRSVERNSRVAGGPVPPTLASDILGRPRRQTSPEPPPEEPSAATDPDPEEPDGSDRTDRTGDDAATTFVDPASTRRTGPRRRPEPDVGRTARDRGRRNPTVGRDTGPLPTQQAGGEAGGDGEEADDEVVDEPTERREPEDSEIDDAETVDDESPADESPDDRTLHDDTVDDDRAGGVRRT